MTSSLILAVLNAATVPGVLSLSYLCDRVDVTNVILISTVGSALSVFLCWGLATSLPVIAVFAVLYGFFAGGFTSTYAGTVKTMRALNPSADLGVLFGLLSVGRGIGNVACGPISEALLGREISTTKALYAYGSEFGLLIVFTGVIAALATVAWFAQIARLL